MLYIVKKWDAGIRGTCWGGDGVGGVGCGAGGWGGGVGCDLEDIYSFTPGHLPTQTFTHLIKKTRLFKYIEMFTSKNRKFSGKKL